MCRFCCGLRIGDVVEAIPPNALACGSGLYPHAVVVSVKPFILISESGDMLWRATQTPADVRRVTGRPVRRTAAFARLDREVEIVLIGDCQECL